MSESGDGVVHFNLGASDPWDEEDYPDVIFHRVPSVDIVYETPPQIPKFIDKYLLGNVLGEGSYARVKEALDTQTLRRAAVKIMKKKKLRKIPFGEESMKREISLLQKMSPDQHLNIIQLFDVHYRPEKQKTYLFMTFCCCSLQDMLDSSEDKKFPLWQAHKYIVQTLNGLEYLHSKNVIHKDVKPANLLLDPSHNVKLCDFGVAEQLNLYTSDDMVKGSQGAPMFQAPEIATGKDVFSGMKLDVWSAGVSLFNFVTGNYPFNAENVFKLYRKIGEGTFVIPDYLPVHLQSLLAGMLRYEYQDRFTVQQCLKQEWLLRKHNKTYEEVPVPNNIAEESTLIPYLEKIHASDTTLVHSPQKSSSDVLNTASSNEDGLSQPHILSSAEDHTSAAKEGSARPCKMQ